MTQEKLNHEDLGILDWTENIHVVFLEFAKKVM
jgi:hypothetical protein